MFYFHVVNINEDVHDDDNDDDDNDDDDEIIIFSARLREFL
jgi:hypothetical protein